MTDINKSVIHCSTKPQKIVHLQSHGIKPAEQHPHGTESAPQHIHGHEHSNGDVHTHEHLHPHTHSHKNTKMVLNRLSRASGHLDAVKRMIEDGKDCSEVLIQLSAVIAALHKTGKVILSDHISNCIVDAVASGNQKAIDELNTAIDRFIK